MALVSCPECNKKISDRAISCPNCGFPFQELKKSQNKSSKAISSISTSSSSKQYSDVSVNGREERVYRDLKNMMSRARQSVPPAQPEVKKEKKIPWFAVGLMAQNLSSQRLKQRNQEKEMMKTQQQILDALKKKK